MCSPRDRQDHSRDTEYTTHQRMPLEPIEGILPLLGEGPPAVQLPAILIDRRVMRDGPFRSS